MGGATFLFGYFSRFYCLFGGNLYFDLTGNDILLSKMRQLLFIPKIGVILISGVLGELVTWLYILGKP